MRTQYYTYVNLQEWVVNFCIAVNVVTMATGSSRKARPVWPYSENVLHFRKSFLLPN